jgi:hypothetical protein
MEENFVFEYWIKKDGKITKKVQMEFCDNKAEDNNLNLVLSKVHEFLNAIGYDIAKLEARNWTSLK